MDQVLLKQILERAKLICCALLLFVLSCGSAYFAATWGKLTEAASVKDVTQLPLARRVLLDSLRRTYKFDFETREAAFDLIRATQATEFSGLVRQIAAMSVSSGDEVKATLDLISIYEALRTLVSLHDVEAAHLNLLRVDKEAWLVQSGSLRNLRTLQYWSATSKIESFLGSAALGSDNAFVIGGAVKFLADSPETSEATCALLPRIEKAYSDCLSPEAEEIYCQEFGVAMKVLRARLSCPTHNEGAW
jgi:hypothetical protein